MQARRMVLAGLIVGILALTPVLGVSADAEYTIYFLGVQPSVDPAFVVFLKGVTEADAILPNVEVVYMGLTAEEINPEGIIDKLETAIAAKADGIVTGFWMLEAEDEVVRRAIAQGIPVMAYNQPDPRPKGERIPYLGFVGVNPFNIGEEMAYEMMRHVTIERAAIGIHHVGSASVETTASGIASVLDEQGIPNEKLDITIEPSTAISVLTSYLTRYPETNVIFLLGAAGSDPAITLVREQGLEGEVFLGTIEVTDKVSQALEDGIALFGVVQQSWAQAYYAIVELYNYLEFGIFPSEEMLTGPIFITADNLDTYQKQLEEVGGG